MAQKRDAFVERLLHSTRGTFDIFSIYIGVRLGFYEALAEAGPLTSPELASRTRTSERYVREWLEQQTVVGILEVDDEKAEATQRRFSLPAAYAEVLVDQESVNYLAPLTRLLAGAVHPLASVLEAYRTGGGVPYAEYGSDLREGQAGINRGMFLKQLGSEWLPVIPDVHARLMAAPPARIADVGCGAGWSSIGMAQSYPKVYVDGFDLDEASVELARANAEAAGLTDRVKFSVRDAGDPQLAGRYDLVTAFECLHDMSQPVPVLKAMRQLAGDNGAVLVVDERVGEAFTAAGNDVEWMMYGWSILHCLPVGKADEPSAETGTVMRPDTLQRYAMAAGFRRVEILPIDNFFFRFYRLHI
ncbi:MAG: methyltransferase domain-containing protein [candidate division NC10 bacterium]|nr:methyltransferase domain-containing protein [candidate division NC10 bacterium]